MLASLPFPHVTVYLDVPPEQCHERIHGLRKRAAEVDSGIPLDYLKGLHGCYEQFLGQMEQRGSSVVRLDWTRFGSADDIAAAIVAADSEAAWDTKALQRIVDAPEEIVRRMRGPKVGRTPTIDADEQDDEELNNIDLESSNNAEMMHVAPKTMAPASPQNVEL